MTESAVEAAANAMLALERENDRPSHLDYARAAIDAASPLLAAEIERLNTYLDGQVRYYNERRQKDLSEIERLTAAHDDYMVRANANVCELNREIERMRAEIEGMKLQAKDDAERGRHD
jgi:hypothetical protein